jgi:aldehyde:ferredoxin oxidoreductase
MCKLDMQKITELNYKKNLIDKGYNNQYLEINTSNNEIKINKIDKEIKDKFIGGKGFDLWLMWESISNKMLWDNPENPICISSGPLGGTPNYPGSGKSTVTSISPLTRSIIDSNVGGYFGPYLKFSGFDALKITGKSKNEIVIFIDGISEKIKIFNIKNIKSDSYTISDLLTKEFSNSKNSEISVVSTGSGAKNTLMGCLNFSWYDNKRKQVRYKQAGRGGIGTVLANKNIKAIVARWSKVSIKTNKPADIENLKKVGRLHSGEIIKLDPKQNQMAKIGTTHLVPIMNDFDLLPTNNFQYGSHKNAFMIGKEVFENLFDPGFDGCWKGCTVACAHGVKNFVPITGAYKGIKVFVDGPEYETIAGCGSNIGIFDPYTILEINFYCDTYGLDTISVGTSIAFVMECYERKIINKDITSGLELNFGNRSNALKLIHQMAEGKNFGYIVGQGIRKMKKIFVEKYKIKDNLINEIGMESKGLEFSEYITKESLAQQGGYGMALKGAQHDEAWLIFLDMVHNFMPTFKEKAEALHWFPMFRTWFSLCGLCKLPWNDIVPEDNHQNKEPAKVVKHIEWYTKYFNAVTGKSLKSEDLLKMSETVYNFQRILNLKMGFGTRKYDYLPYRAMGPVTKEEYESRKERYDTELTEKYKINISKKNTEEKILILKKIRKEQYEKLKDSVYKRRGWNNNGIPTIKTVRELGLDSPEILELLKNNGVTE